MLQQAGVARGQWHDDGHPDGDRLRVRLEFRVPRHDAVDLVLSDKRVQGLSTRQPGHLADGDDEPAGDVTGLAGRLRLAGIGQRERFLHREVEVARSEQACGLRVRAGRIR